MNRTDTMYHKVLRVITLVTAFVLLFESGLVSQSTAVLSDNTENYLANAIGVGASVQPTELNQFTAELTARELALDEREAALNQREIAVNLSTDTNEQDASTYLLASILFILLVLILLNYALDYLRAREEQSLQGV